MLNAGCVGKEAVGNGDELDNRGICIAAELFKAALLLFTDCRYSEEQKPNMHIHFIISKFQDLRE